MLLSRHPDVDLSAATGDGNTIMHLCAFNKSGPVAAGHDDGVSAKDGPLEVLKVVVSHARDVKGMQEEELRR